MLTEVRRKLSYCPTRAVSKGVDIRQSWSASLDVSPAHRMLTFMACALNNCSRAFPCQARRPFHSRASTSSLFHSMTSRPAIAAGSPAPTRPTRRAWARSRRDGAKLRR